MKVVRKLKRHEGFTVMELILTIAVAMVVLAIAIPSFFTFLPTLRLSYAARQVATDLQLARMKAISQNRKFRVNFSGSTYTLQKDNGGAFTTESGPFSLPDGITVQTVVPATSEFQPRGTVNAASTVTLRNINNATKSVEVNVVGRVKIS